ncbi:hypothetical protein DH2020_012551 [Rehmannia glutinosa]|uniref:Amino acid transporter transmembrane domain-containing protein n=1 Tax=Rehmannia glutinosa TaxID=99300 RepID=A0ABR0WZN4_REHGL
MSIIDLLKSPYGSSDLFTTAKLSFTFPSTVHGISFLNTDSLAGVSPSAAAAYGGVSRVPPPRLVLLAGALLLWGLSFFLAEDGGGGWPEVGSAAAAEWWTLAMTWNLSSLCHLKCNGRGPVVVSSETPEMKAEERWWLTAALWVWYFGREKWSGENEGTGSRGRLEGFFERQDCSVVAITLYSVIASGASIWKGITHHQLINYGFEAHSTSAIIFDVFSSLGLLAFAFAFAGHSVALEIQATIPSTPD